MGQNLQPNFISAVQVLAQPLINMHLEPCDLKGQAWNELITSFPNPHILQSWEWGEVKSSFGWDMTLYIWRNPAAEVTAASLVLRRTIPVPGLTGRLNFLYLPKGPLLMDWSDDETRQQVLIDLSTLAKDLGGFFVKIDPDIRLGIGIPGKSGCSDDPMGQTLQSELQNMGWLYSNEQVQFRNTVVLDLQPTEDDLLANMKQKTRYNIRLAGRKGVVIRTGDVSDLDDLFSMYVETSMRDGFVIRDERYYHAVWSGFMQAGMAEPLIAEVDGQSVAGLILFHFAGQAWYLYGMSRLAHRDKMPNYLLQWAAIRRAKEMGCVEYDLWGAPEIFNDQDPLWGVYRFKSGLGGKVVRHIGAWDLPLNSFLYRTYTNLLPKALDVLRRRGLSSTRKRLPE